MGEFGGNGVQTAIQAPFSAPSKTIFPSPLNGWDNDQQKKFGSAERDVYMGTNRDREITVFILALLGLKGVGARTVIDIIGHHHDSLESSPYLDAEYAEALNVGKVTKALQSSDLSWEELERDAFEILESAENAGVLVLNPLSSEYPQRLLRNDNYPPILYCLGDSAALNPEKSVAMVGTRNPTDFGGRMGRRLAELLASDDYVIVSGLALGCDSMAHEGALDAHGRTVAVLPTPIGAPVYPKQNQGLAERIIESGGALVSEYPPNMMLTDRQLVTNLVARDEWQPGLADGLIAFETSVDGGTRHAMKHALKTKTPIAVFDYSTRQGVDFWGDERFGGNVAYLKSGEASRIFEPQTIEDFKIRMEAYRDADGSEAPIGSDPAGSEGIQISMSFE